KDMFGNFLAWQNERLLMRSASGTLQLRSISAGTITAERSLHFDWSSSIVWSPDDQSIATQIARRDRNRRNLGANHVLIWHDGSLQTDIPVDHPASLAWRADNQTLITAIQYPCVVQAWDTKTGKQVPLSNHLFEQTPPSCGNLTVRPDGEVIAVSYLK